jgi:hypothetical protein
MHRSIVLALTLALAISCAKNSDSQLQEGFQRFAENFHLRLQRQYFEPRFAPSGVVIKLADKPSSHLDGTRGSVVFTQSESTDTTERDVRITLNFDRQGKSWVLADGQAQVIAQAKRSKQKEPAVSSPTDVMADEVYGPRIKAALELTPPE